MSELIDNRANRIRILKGIIQHLHAGGDVAQVKSQMREIVGQTDYSEIVAMEQELMAEGMPVEEIQSMCDLHSQVTRDVLVQLTPPSLPPGHPAETFHLENEALRKVIHDARSVLGSAEVLPEAALLAGRQTHNDLMDIDKHYQRKEHTLFSCLERHGITGPSKVMWAKDDEVRRLLRQWGAAMGRHGAAVREWKPAAEAALAAVEEMIYKEENILLPMCRSTFTEEEWAEIWAASPRYGWCLVEPRIGYRPPETSLPEALRLAASESVQLPTGSLSVDQLIGIFSTLPVDITFVDAEDRVRFFSEGPDRVFARSKAVIGRMVQHCHPPRSVDVVDRILNDFRSGRQKVAEFWINFQGRFVHIRYFPVRDAAGAYLGTLEVTQDVSGIRALEGERRLLQYDES